MSQNIGKLTMKPKVSIVTPSIRIDGLYVLKEALEEQTFKDFEWLICSPTDPGIRSARWIPDKFTEGFWTLNRAYNSLFKHSQGELIVTLQDWIWIAPDGIEKFVISNPKLDRIISGVGDQYESIDSMGKPHVKIWSDPRKNTEFGSFYECNWNDIEWNYASFPKAFIFEIGGMDEKLDFLGYGGDQFQVGERWESLNKLTYLDQSNESFTIRHDRSAFGGQLVWDSNHVLFNRKYDERKAELIAQGKWPVLDYLPLA